MLGLFYHLHVSLSGARCVVCRPGSLIGFKLITQRSGPNRQSQASKSNAKPQKNPTSCGKTDGKRQAAIFPSCFSIFQLPVSRPGAEKRKKKEGYHERSCTGATPAETKLAVMHFRRTWMEGCFSERKKCVYLRRKSPSHPLATAPPLPCPPRLA